jgi:hypothetical protein
LGVALLYGVGDNVAVGNGVELASRVFSIAVAMGDLSGVGGSALVDVPLGAMVAVTKSKGPAGSSAFAMGGNGLNHP